MARPCRSCSRSWTDRADSPAATPRCCTSSRAASIAPARRSPRSSPRAHRICTTRRRRSRPGWRPASGPASTTPPRVRASVRSGAAPRPRASSRRTKRTPSRWRIAWKSWRAGSPSTASTSTVRIWRGASMSSDGAAFLEAAAGLARRITDAAVWADGRCNWVGALGREQALSSGHAAVAALGPDLYEGTSGVALFLAEAAVRLDEPRLRATALGAIRLALEQGGRVGGDGLYSGRPGIAYAATRVAGLLSAEDVAARAEALLAPEP